MPTPQTIIDNTLRSIGAIIYFLVLFSLIGYLCYDFVSWIIYKIKEKKEEENAEIRER